jgi:hypothetical protein
LFGTRDAEALGNDLRRFAHLISAKRIFKQHHRAVAQRTIAETRVISLAEGKKRLQRHILIAARHHDLRIAASNHIRRRPDRLQTRGAEPIDGLRRHVDRQAGRDCTASRVVGIGPGLAHLAHHDLIDFIGRYPRAFERRRNGRRPEFVRRRLRKTAIEFADRRPRAGDQCYRFHPSALRHQGAELPGTLPRNARCARRRPASCVAPERVAAGACR